MFLDILVLAVFEPFNIAVNFIAVSCNSTWRVVRVVEGARLESVYTGNRIEGSNPSLSAI